MYQVLVWSKLGDFGLTFGVLIHDNEKVLVV
jgi:hypothetical protein